MPKEIVSAEQVLSGLAGPSDVAVESPVVETPAEKAEPTPPAPGFEDPPKSEGAEPIAEEPAPAAAVVEPEAPSAADVLAGAAEEPEVAAAPPPAPVAAQPESLANQVPPKSEAKAENIPPLPGAESPKPTTQDPVEPTAKEVEAAAQSWRFVKNIHPGEVVTLKDGTVYPFPKNNGVHTVTDPEIAAKLLEVADIFHIVLQ